MILFQNVSLNRLLWDNDDINDDDDDDDNDDDECENDNDNIGILSNLTETELNL